MRRRPRSGKDGKAGDYEVGYGKPPREGRFRPGQSGNPKGRPKNSRNFKTVLHQALAERVTLVEGGVRRRVSKREAFVFTVINNALRGDPKGVTSLLLLIRSFGADGTDPEASGSTQLTDDDHALIASFLRRRKRKDESE
jgi:hypothetical protein